MEYIIKIFSLNTIQMAYFRIVLGVALLIDLSWKLTYSNLWFSENGVLSRAEQISQIHPNFWSLFFLSGSDLWPQILIFIGCLLSIGLLIGLNSRYMALGLWIIVVSMQNRNLMIVNGGDDLLRFLLLFTIFLPVDDKLSFKHKNHGINYFSISTIAVVLFTLLFYWQTGFLKTGSDWQQGNSVRLMMGLDVMNTEFGAWLSNYPKVLKFFSYGSWYLEKYGIFLILFPFIFIRKIVVLSFIAMHLGIFLTLKIGVFPLLCGALWILLWPQNTKSEKVFSKASLWGVLLISIHLWWTLAGVQLIKPVPDQIRQVVYSFRLDHHWSMFSPSVLRQDGYFIFQGFKDLEGREIIPLENNFVFETFPEKLSSNFKWEAERKYFLNLALPHNANHLNFYLRHLCYKYQSQEIFKVKVWFVEQLTMLNKDHEKLEPKLLIEKECF